MFRGLRHTLFLVLQLGIWGSAAAAASIWHSAWPAVLVVALGASATAAICMRFARVQLRVSLGRLRRVADDLGHGRPAEPIEVQPGDDLYKLISAVNLLAARLIEADQERNHLHEQLRHRERLAFLGELAANVAHEVNNPLDGIQNCARILRKQLDDPARAHQMLDLIENGLVRIETTVRRLLMLARENNIRPSPASLSDVVASAVRTVESRLTDGGVRVLQHLAQGDDRVSVDRLLLEQVFVNLVINAADSMPDGGDVDIDIARMTQNADGRLVADAGGELLIVNVADRGPGIANDAVAHIFEPFFTTKDSGKGTGLGLPIAARIVDAHRGAIQVAQRSGGGSVFSVRLPALPAGPRADSQLAPANNTPSTMLEPA